MTETTPDADQQDQALHDGPKPIERNGNLYVPLKLAHPLSEKDAERCGALVKKAYNVGNIIRVGREWGLAMIDGGRVDRATVDPDDPASVRKALFLNKKNQPLTSEEVDALFPAPVVASETPGPVAGDADAAGPAKVEAQQSAADKPPAAKRASSTSSN